MSSANNNNEPDKGGHILSWQLVAYIDILGFSDAVAKPTPDTQNIILEMLQEFKAAEGNFAVVMEPEKIVKPAISAFSDHLVMTFNLEKWQGDEGSIYRALMAIRSVANSIAYRARRISCLIRGAVVIGPLYHESGIIFGDGLVKAYELESKPEHRPPRIVIDDNVLIGTLFYGDSEYTIYRDEKDGKFCLDYMTAYLDSIGENLKNEPIGVQCRARKDWALVTRADSRDHARKLRAEGKTGPADKWDWFVTRFERSMLSANQHLFSPDGAALVFPD